MTTTLQPRTKAGGLAVGAGNCQERRRLLEEDAAVPMLGAVPAPAAAPRTARSLEHLMDNLGESFTTRLLRLIDERG